MLVLVGGGTNHLAPFSAAAHNLGVDLVTASFSQLTYTTSDSKFKLNLVGIGDIADFDCIYLRLVGKRYEDVSLVCSYAAESGVMMVDSMYGTAKYTRLPLAKALETKLLVQAGVPVPKTLLTKLAHIAQEAPALFGFPFVIKGTFGKQGHAVWAPRDEAELAALIPTLKEREKKKGERFLAQEFVYASQRNRVFVVGGKAVAAITRPTRWRARFMDKVDGVVPKEIRSALVPVPERDAQVAVKAAQALGVDIGGVDVVHEDKSGKTFVFEVNSAPRWAALKRETGIDIEQEIVAFIKAKIENQ